MLRRYFHVVQHVDTKDKVLDSRDTYELARDLALEHYNRAPPDQQFQIHSGGVIVWGPYVTGDTRYRP